jgi:hypothetical protein
MRHLPYSSGTITHMRENKVYNCQLFNPHLLALAINDAHPSQATRYAVNIGAGDGKSCNDPVYPLYQQGFGGLCIEGANEPKLAENLPADNITKLTATRITPIDIASVLAENSCPTNIDLLKIDIDGYDGPILQEILASGYRPKVIQVEVNPEIPPPIQFAVLYHPDYRCATVFNQVGGFYGASVAYVCNLGKKYGYRLAYMDFVTGWTHDIALVREDYFNIAISVFGLDITLMSPRQLYLKHPPGYSHFAEFGIDSLAWRYRTDYHQLLTEIWDACMRANIMKNGGTGTPFHLSLAGS